MKKVFAITICVMMVCMLAVSVFAGSADDSVKAATIELFISPKGSELDNGFQMRGFTASPDGKYVYAGVLQGGRLVGRYDTATKELKGTYKPASADNELYCKGLAVDDRGYLFVGITHASHSDIAIAAVDENMEQVGYLSEDLGKPNTGINGVAVQKIKDQYFLFAVTAYDVDSIRCYDVTDPKNIKLDSNFGANGVFDYPTIIGGTGDASYIAADEEGYLYLTHLKSGSGKGSHVTKINWDGTSVVNEVELAQAYGICVAGDYVFVATNNKANSNVHVLNKSDLSEVTTLDVPGQSGNSLSDIAFGGGYLFVGDHGDNSANMPGLIFRSAAQIKVAADAQPQDPGTDTDEETKAEDPGTQAPDTTPEETTGETNPPAPQTGDAVIIGVAAVACIALAGAVIGKKIIK